MKALAIACAAVVLMCGTALADDAAVPNSTLASMGLDSMKPLSDDDGREVRGEGLTFGVIHFSIGASMKFSDISMKFADIAQKFATPKL